MLGVSSYAQEYVDSCRTRVDRQLAAYRALAKTAKPPAVDKFEPLFLSNMVLVLDESFVHRLRGKEGKAGNPLNEVRMLCASILQHDGVMTKDTSIKYQPEQSVLKIEVGDPITLTEPELSKLAKAFFAELESRFVEG